VLYSSYTHSELAEGSNPRLKQFHSLWEWHYVFEASAIYSKVKPTTRTIHFMHFWPVSFYI